jgi:hypothetical protein
LFEHVIDLILDAQHAKHCSKSAGKSLTREELTAVWTTGTCILLHMSIDANTYDI